MLPSRTLRGDCAAAEGALPVACWGQTCEDYIFRASGRLREDIDELVPGGGHEHVVADEVAGRADVGEPEEHAGQRRQCSSVSGAPNTWAAVP